MSFGAKSIRSSSSIPHPSERAKASEIERGKLLFSTTDVKRSKFPGALRAKRMMTNAPKYCFLHPPPQDRRNCSNRKGAGKGTETDYTHPILPKLNAVIAREIFNWSRDLLHRLSLVALAHHATYQLKNPLIIA